MDPDWRCISYKKWGYSSQLCDRLPGRVAISIRCFFWKGLLGDKQRRPEITPESFSCCWKVPKVACKPRWCHSCYPKMYISRIQWKTPGICIKTVGFFQKYFRWIQTGGFTHMNPRSKWVEQSPSLVGVFGGLKKSQLMQHVPWTEIYRNYGKMFTIFVGIIKDFRAQSFQKERRLIWTHL